MVVRLVYLGDNVGNPPIIRHCLPSGHARDRLIPESPYEYNKCIEAGGSSGVLGQSFPKTVLTLKNRKMIMTIRGRGSPTHGRNRESLEPLFETSI
ncbi:hypothetical protein M5689_025192 [Euphorbia peplus]|nr:hypothetical protein M5689_025192 [Euphorbia peplus]